jgi:hypothetical protein
MGVKVALRSALALSGHDTLSWWLVIDSVFPGIDWRRRGRASSEPKRDSRPVYMKGSGSDGGFGGLDLSGCNEA